MSVHCLKSARRRLLVLGRVSARRPRLAAALFSNTDDDDDDDDDAGDAGDAEDDDKDNDGAADTY